MILLVSQNLFDTPIGAIMIWSHCLLWVGTDDEWKAYLCSTDVNLEWEYMP